MNTRHALLATLLAVLLLPVAAALAFTQPLEGANFTANATVLFTWDAQPVTFSITGSAAEEINATSTTRTLTEGTYTATITDATNATANRTITITPAPPATTNASTNQTNQTQSNQAIGVSTDAALYEAGTSARIRVTVTEPEQLTLTVTRPSGSVDTYTIAVTVQTDFLYATTTTGTYAISVSGQTSGAAAASSFVVQNTTVTAQITGATSGTAGRITSFGSLIQGGTAPFTYTWQFSDNTTSSGSTADHVFETPGTYTVALVVTDSASRSASATRSVPITVETYRLTVNVLGQNNRLLRNATVVIASTAGAGGASRSGVTDDLGRIRFTNLTPGVYAVNTTYNATEFTPLVRYSNNRTVNLTDDTSVTITLAVPDPAAVNTTNSTNATNSTTTGTNSTNSTSSATSNSIGAVQPASTAAQEQTLKSMQEAYEQSLASTRADAEDEIRDREAAIARSESRAAIATVLDLDARFAAANKAISDAQTEDAVKRALDAAPRDVTILSRDSTVATRTYAEAEADIDAYVAALATDADTEKSIRYSIREALKGSSIATRRSVVRVTDGSNAATTYTIIEREGPVSAGMHYIEIIPKSFASDVTELALTGSHEVVAADPIIRFLTNEYSYTLIGESDAKPTVLLVPATLLENPGLLGLVAVKLNLGSTERGGLYLAGIAIILAGLICGNIALRSRSGSSVKAFNDLAGLAIAAAENATAGNGNRAAVASYLKELEAIAATLAPADQADIAETMIVLRSVVASGEFRAALEHCKNSIDLDDTTAMAAAYERLLAAHAALSPDAQTHAQSSIDAAHVAIEEHLDARESGHHGRHSHTHNKRASA